MLFENVQFVTVSEAAAISDGTAAAIGICVKEQSVTLNVPLFWIWRPPVTFIPLIDVISPAAMDIAATELPLTVNRFAPGPVIVKVSFTPLMVITDARVMVCGELKCRIKHNVVRACGCVRVQHGLAQTAERRCCSCS